MITEGIIDRKQQAGVALVIVLWMLVLLTVMATGYSRMMRTETLLTANLVRSAQAQALAEAGIHQAIIELYKPKLEKTWKADGTNYEYLFNGATIKIQIQAENGKIDLNTARAELLEGLLLSVGHAEDKRQSIVQAILDWRDKDNLAREQGAEDTDYALASINYGAKDGPFNSIDELLLVKGMTAELYHQIQPILTIYSHQTGIDPLTASRKALLAIPNVSEIDVDDYLEQRNNEAEFGQSLPFDGIDSKYLARNQGTVFTITSEAKVHLTIARLKAVISFRGNDTQPYTVLAWQDAPIVNEPNTQEQKEIKEI